MERSESCLSWRLWLAMVADAAILALHLPALARARASHTYSWYGHPWHDTSVDLFIFLFLAIAIVAAVPVVVRSSGARRYLAIGLLALPLYVVVTFLLWSFRLYGN